MHDARAAARQAGRGVGAGRGPEGPGARAAARPAVRRRRGRVRRAGTGPDAPRQGRARERRAISARMIGRVRDRRSTSRKPALRKAEGTPMYTKASGVRSIVGSAG